MSKEEKHKILKLKTKKRCLKANQLMKFIIHYQMI